MANYDKETKFYWLQLKEDFFEDDAIQWLEEQEPNGRDYAYFYLKLCLKSLKSNGFLIRKVGNVLIPYDNKKLAELTKMDFDTVTVAMELLKQIGLVQILESGEIYITQLQNLIGSVSKGALKKQQQRELKNINKKILEWTESGQVSTKDKDKDKDKDKIKENNKRKVFQKPTIKEIDDYCKERNNNVRPEQFYDFYESKGWVVGKSPMKDWKAAIRTWEKGYNNRTKADVPKWFDKDYGEDDGKELSEEDYEFIRELKGGD